MSQEASKRILLVGATGCAGRKLSSYLLKETGATVILAGRSRAKLDDLQSDLRQQDISRRSEVLELDATNLATPLLDNDGEPKDVFLEDGLHLNEEGYTLWQEALALFLE